MFILRVLESSRRVLDIRADIVIEMAGILRKNNDKFGGKGTEN